VGINGVPSYTNALTRYRRADTSGNHFTAIAVAGEDSIEIEPCASDTVETSSINSQYRGWRETAGAEWQRVYSNRSFGVLSVSDSQQVEHIHQQDQILDPLKPIPGRHACPIPHNLVQSVPVYMEDSNNAFSTAKYRIEWQGSGVAMTAGSAVWLQRPNFDVAQPIGAFSPYVGTLKRTDSTSFGSRFSTGESGSFGQVFIYPVAPLSISAGGGMQTFAFGGRMSLTPRLNASYRMGEKAGMNIAYAAYAQLPPYEYLLSYPANRSLLPMRVTHKVVGMDLGFLPDSQVRLEALCEGIQRHPSPRRNTLRLRCTRWST
jgi:hypothetical protein